MLMMCCIAVIQGMGKLTLKFDIVSEICTRAIRGLLIKVIRKQLLYLATPKTPNSTPSLRLEYQKKTYGQFSPAPVHCELFPECNNNSSLIVSKDNTSSLSGYRKRPSTSNIEITRSNISRKMKPSQFDTILKLSFVSYNDKCFTYDDMLSSDRYTDSLMIKNRETGKNNRFNNI